LAQRLEASEQARKEQAFEVQQLYEDLAKLLGRTDISENGEA